MSIACFDSCWLRRYVLRTIALFCVTGATGVANDLRQPALSEFGRVLFFSTALSDDRHTSCSSCHAPDHAFADPKPLSIGAHGVVGTRNAPSLVGVAQDRAFFWDGRRTRLEQAVMDPFTNRAELGLSSQDEVVQRIRANPEIASAFRAAFGNNDPTLDDVALALSSFVVSLKTGSSEFDLANAHQSALPPQAQHGRELFEGVAGCSQCHQVVPDGRFHDDEYHFTAAPLIDSSHTLADLAREVVTLSLTDSALGNRILSDSRWASLGRFVVTQRPNDIGAYRTPSLRNVALTAPYMHDGHIATLEQAVDHEIYYRSQQADHAAQVTESERSAIVAFLRTLSDSEEVQKPTVGSDSKPRSLQR